MLIRSITLRGCMGHISAEGSRQINEGTADQLLLNLP